MAVGSGCVAAVCIAVCACGEGSVCVWLWGVCWRLWGLGGVVVGGVGGVAMVCVCVCGCIAVKSGSVCDCGVCALLRCSK